MEVDTVATLLLKAPTTPKTDVWNSFPLKKSESDEQESKGQSQKDVMQHGGEILIPQKQ